jgi:hypothetical protein
MTRQPFDARALSSPPFPLSQHLSRSRGIPTRLLEVPVPCGGCRRRDWDCFTSSSVFQNMRSSNGANPLHNPSPINKKAVYNCVRSEPCLISLTTKALGKAERMCKRPQSHCLRQQRDHCNHINPSRVKRYQKKPPHV